MPAIMIKLEEAKRAIAPIPEVIYQHYAGNKRELFVPEF